MSLLALGEQVGTDADLAHVKSCPECADELSELHRLVTLARTVDAETAMVVPSPDVWARIRDELALNPALEPLADRSPYVPSVHPEHPQRSLLAVIKAALAGSSRGSTDELVAHADLTPVEADGSDASGEAVLATDELGRRILQVSLEARLPESGVRQAWLVHREDPTLKQSLGILDGPFGVWTVDKSIDLEQYAILDISQQGVSETEYSGHTIVRGQLTLVA